MIARAILSFQLQAFGVPLGRIGGFENRTMTDKRRCSTKSAHAASLFFIAFVSGISFPLEGFAYSGLTGKVSSLLCQTRVAAAGSQEDYARTLYAAADPVVQQRCLGCHIENGIAPNAGAKLALKSTDTAEYENFNHQTFQTLISLRSAQYVLSKAMGSAHGGGSVLTAFSSDYQALSDYLKSLDNKVACSNAAGIKGSANAEAAVWRGVGFSSPAETYRRAAIVIGRTVPTQDQMDSVASGAISLKAALEDLMQGDGFHDFLITGANDQLLTDAAMSGFGPINTDSAFFPSEAVVMEQFFEELGGEERYRQEGFHLKMAQNYGNARAPTELIAYVVENDLSYKEVLTADFEMMTPLTADIFAAGIDWGEPVVYDGTYSSFHMQFKPGENLGQMWYQEGPVTCVPVAGGDCYPATWEGIRRPHAGVLSTLAFLQRYPTTETNRNRARARWAYKFFLGVDIEASASRTTDPVALADTNNPTMHNPACTVCHQGMDPVAGAFQNYDARGFYRPFPNGNDKAAPGDGNALPGSYKWIEESVWEYGDTWYRDMRAPGFNGRLAPNSETSLAWLGSEMANDPRFALGTVEFWWPAVMGHEVLRAPEDPTLPGYADQLMAFNLQRTEIGRLALVFSSSGFNLKTLLAELLQSKWFNAVAMDAEHPYAGVLQLAGIGAKRLLTPEELLAKTRALVGVTVGLQIAAFGLPLELSYVDDNRIAIGGIDSHRVKSRARGLSSLGALVAATHAHRAACTVAKVERVIQDSQRSLLNGVDFTEPVADTPSLRETIRHVYRRLHGRDYPAAREEIGLVVELLLEAYQLEGTCYSWDQEPERLMALARSAGTLADDADRSMTAVESKNTKAWELALDFMFSHYDYAHE